MITGTYSDANLVSHGFVRAANGSVTTFDAPGGSNTSVLGINSEGTIVGTYVAGTGNLQVFLRAAADTFTTIELPGGLAFPAGAFDMNARGEIVGSYIDNTVFGFDNFLRNCQRYYHHD